MEQRQSCMVAIWLYSHTVNEFLDSIGVMTSSGSSRFRQGHLGPEGLETGARHTHFWKDAVQKEVVQRAYHKPALIAEVTAGWEKNSDTSPFGKEADHGLVYCTLHDLHRAKAGFVKSRSASDLRLPPVQRRIAPVPMGGLWRWPGGPPLPADVESVITATTASIPPSAFSVLTTSHALPKSSLTPLPPQEDADKPEAGELPEQKDQQATVHPSRKGL
eukprot:s24_g14.t1